MSEVARWVGFGLGVAAPGPWSGLRRGFPDLVDRPDAPEQWVIG